MVAPRALTRHRLVGLDVNVFIYDLERHPVFYQPARTALAAIAGGLLAAVASTLALAELLVVPFRDDTQDVVERYTDYLTTLPNLTLVAPDVAICRTAARLRAAHRALRLPDAVHLATAIERGATAFLTNDLDLRRVDGVEIVRLGALAR